MKKKLPTLQELESYSKKMPVINPSAVAAMLTLKQVALEFQHEVMDMLQKEYHVSGGKLWVMIILHQNGASMSPSDLAQKASVTKATISNMIKRMLRDGLIEVSSNNEDGRAKKVRLSQKGISVLEGLMPDHCARIGKLMNKLSADEQRQLLYLLQKLSSS